MKRIHSIDITRGIVMIIMALDHVRDLIHTTSITQSPTDLATTSPFLFFTRWVTYLCAPVFVFLSGTSAFLSFTRSNNFAASRRFLWTRGVWLIALDLTVINFALWFDIHFNVFLFNVVSAIGFGYIILGLVLKLSGKTIAIVGLLIVFLHNLAPLIPLAETSTFKKLLMPFFGPGAIPLGGGKTFVIGYPPVPWLAVMLLGFASGKLFEREISDRKKIFYKTGLGAILLSVLIRFVNIYGDAAPWSTQKNSLYTFLSFLDITKYPPSLVYCLLFLGIMFLILSAAEGLQNKFTKIAVVYGKVPLFYFLLHFFIIHILMFLILFWQGYRVSDFVFGFNFGRPKGMSGLSLPGVYLTWAGVVALLYPLCLWYGKYKQTHPEKKWLRYL
ncbi:MAG: DUF1624 domain-containing protein [Sphingobacteriales bacterium]|nr:DUF1624 domain-containing protein [Sphingobacteriales bacterium]